jgi:PTS system fructose-specific IIC component
MTGTNAILLGAILGLMIAFDMDGLVNKTAFLFGAGLIATGNQPSWVCVPLRFR